jgi:translocation and assembly module TamB
MSALAKPSEAARPRRRWLAWLAGGLLALLLLPLLGLGAALFWADGEAGRARIASLVAGQVAGLSLEGLEGPLTGSLGIRRLTLADADGIWLEIEGARLDWDPRALLRRQAHATLLAADRLVLHRLPGGGGTASPGPLIPDLPALPFAIGLDRLALARIEIGAALLGEAAAFRAAGSGRLDRSGLSAVLDLQALGQEDALGLEAALHPGSGRLLARLTLRGAAGGPFARLAGLPAQAPSLDLELDGPPAGAALTVQADAGPGLSARLLGTLRAPDIGRLGLDLGGRVDVSGLLSGPLAALAGPLDVAIRGGRLPDGATDLAALRLSGRLGTLAASGRLAADGAAASLAARLDLAGSEAFAALLPGDLLGWSALVVEASAEGKLATSSIAVSLAAAGFRSAIPSLAALLGEAPRLALRGTLPDRLALLTLAGAGLQAEAAGQLGQTLDLGFSADLETLQEVAPGVTGGLRLAGTARGPASDPELTLNATAERLDLAGQVLEALVVEARISQPVTAPAVAATARGSVLGMPLALDLRGGPEGEGRLRLQAATARLGPAEATAEGLLTLAGPRFTGDATLTVPDLAALSPLAGEPLTGSLTLAAALSVREGRQHVAARLAAPHLGARGTAVRDLAGSLEGSEADAEIRLAGRAEAIEAELHGRITEQPDGARRLDLAVLRAAGLGETLRLAAPARVTLRRGGGIEIGALAFAASRGATLRAEGQWGPANADIRASLALPDLATLGALVPDLAPRGGATATLRITGPTSAPEAHATLRATQLRAGAAWARGLPPAALQVDVRRAAGGAITARAEASLGTATRLTATASLPHGPGGPGGAAPLEAALDGQADLGALAAPFLAAGADRLTGRLALALRAGGTLAAPVLGGEARLSAGSWRNVLLGLTITDLGGTLRAEGPRLRLDLAGRTPGEGRLALAGSIEPLGAGVPVELTLRATQAQPIATELVRATLDAELALTGALLTGARLSGPVRLRRVDIRVPEQLPASVRSLGPVTERGRAPGRPAPPPRRARPAEPAPGMPLALALQVAAPRGVFVRGRGLDVELGGDLAIGGSIEAPEIGGAVTLRRGEIRLLARRLALSRGNLLFQGGLMPEMDFEASSQTGDTTVRATVSGPPNAPVIAFTSSPELPPDEVLARLLFDRPINDLSAFEVAQIAQAIAGATGLPGGGASGFLERLRERLALDRLAVGGGGEGAARTTSAEQRGGPQLEAGRYIAEGVYVGVRQGTEGGARIGVRVDLTPRLRLEAETGDREAGERVGVAMEWQWGR